MKQFFKIPFAATLAAALSMGGLARGQSSEASGEADVGQSADTSVPSDPESMSPAAAAFVYYFRIQVALSQDLLTNVAVNARALAAVVQKDTSGGFPPQLAAQASALARDAVTLAGARLDFAIVSGQLMAYLKTRNPPVGLGPIHQLYDPVTKLYWLQTGAPVQNPYLGKTGLRGMPS
jgi:hypothetical protein